jgi:TonB family protein
MPEVLTNTNQGSPIYPVKRSTQRKGMGNLRPVKARLGAAGEAVIIDLSESGIGLELAIPLQPGSTLAVDFDLPESGGHVRVDGRVVWSNAGRRTGIRFERIPDLASERLKRWVSLGSQSGRAASTTEVSSPIQPASAATEIADESPTLERAVVQVLARAMAITKATGAAIAIGPSEAMVCRASAGTAPDIGVPINPDSGLTGYCLRSRATVRCDDTESDQRVNAAACREMEVRSALVIPVFSGKNAEELSGILEVFSSRARAFTAEHIAKLEKLTRILGVVAADLVPDNETRNAESVSSAAPAVATTDKSPVADIPAECKSERAHLPRKIGDRSPSAFSLNAPISTPRDAFNSGTSQTGAAPARVEPQGVGQVKPSALAAPVVTTQIAAKDAAVKLAELSKPAAKSAPSSTEEAKADLRSTSDLVETSPCSDLSQSSFVIEGPSLVEWMNDWVLAARSHGTRVRRALRVLGIVVIVLEIAAAVFLYTRWEKKRAGIKQVRAVQAIPAPTPVASVSPSILSSVLPPPVTPPARHKKSTPAAILPEDGSDDVIVVNRDGTTPSNAPQDASAKEAVSTESEPSLSAPIAGQIDLSAIHLPGSPANPSLAVRLSTGITGGKLIKRVEPTYPEAAKVRGVQGDVILSAHVGADGSVKSVRTVKGNPLLASAAREAVRHWQYQPMKLNGSPVEMDTTVTVEFKLPN